MSDNIQEAEVGSGTKISDTKQSEKRAQITLKAIQLRLKQEKERAALQQQKKSLQVKEEIEESFSPSQIAALKAEYSKINGIDPDSDTYKKLIAMLDRLDLKSLQSLAGAEIKFVSKLAQNRVMRKSMKKEEVQLDELSTNKLADYKKKAGENASAADKAGDTKTGNKRFSGIMKATRKQFDNDAKKSMSEASQKVDSLVTDALKIMQGSELKDAVQALKTVLGDREYNGRRGFYNFYVKQLVDMYGKKANEELDIELDEVLSKDATAGDFIHDFVNSDNPKFAGKSKEKRKQMALAAYYAKQKNEELSPKQKALDKNKNGKIDGSDLAKLRGEELSAKQKALDKNNNGKIDGDDLAKLRKKPMPESDAAYGAWLKGKEEKRKMSNISSADKSKLSAVVAMLNKEKKKQPQGADFAAQRRKERMASSGRMDEAKSDYEVYHKDYSGAVQTAIKQAEKRGYEVDMDDWHDKVATGPKKPSSGKTNSFSINLMKDGKPSKKKLQMQVYNMDNHKYELNMYIEEVEIAEAGPGLWANIQAKRERIKAGSNERMRKPGEKGAPEAGALDRAKGKNEAASPAQQAAIAIAMKKDGKKPKDMEEMTDGDKSSVALQAMVAKKKLQQTAGKNKSQSFIDKMTSKANAGDRLPKKPADEYDRKVVKYLKKKHGMTESIVDKIKAIKRGLEAKAKSDDHFDKAGDPKNANASKDLKKAVRYHNLLNKEETGEKMNAVTKHVTKGELTKSGVAKWLAEPLKKEEAVPEFKQGGPELAKKFNKAFKSMGVDAKVKIKTVSNISTNEEVVTEAKKKSFKDVKKKMKEEEVPSKATIKKGDMLTGKREPIEINPELKEPGR
jgi:hypothetical protein